MDTQFTKGIIKLRKNKKLRIIDVSKNLKVSSQLISNWENGSSFPSSKHWKHLASLYGQWFRELVLRYTLKKTEEKFK